MATIGELLHTLEPDHRQLFRQFERTELKVVVMDFSLFPEFPS